MTDDPACRAAEKIVRNCVLPHDADFVGIRDIIRTELAEALEAKELLEWLFQYQEHDRAWIKINFGDFTRYAYTVEDLRLVRDAARKGGEVESG